MTDYSVRRRTVEGMPMRWLESTGTQDDDRPSHHPPIILLHGMPTSPELWRYVLPLLDDHRVLAWELVGYGDSIPAGAGRDISVGRQADYLRAWLAALDLDRALLVGHDLGGGVAQVAAVCEPGRVAGLVLTNAVAYDAWPVLPMRLLRSTGGLLARLPSSVWRAAFQTVIPRLHQDRAVGLESARTHWAHYADHGGGAAVVRQARSLDAADTVAVQDRLPTLDVPARIVWGDADPFLPIGIGARLAHDLGTTVRAIPGGLHFTPEDHPEAVVAAVRELLD